MTLPSLVADGGPGTGMKTIKAAYAATHINSGVLQVNTLCFADIFTLRAFGAGLLVQGELEK